MIVVVDYDVCNVGSVLNMLKKVGADAKVSGHPNVLASATKLVLPGVGSFDTAIGKIRELGLFDILNQLVTEKKIPVLGICLGMQLFAESSEEGDSPGFGWIPGRISKFAPKTWKEPLPIPHMGWNTVKASPDFRLWRNMPNPSRFYFVHSYRYDSSHQHSVGTSNYGESFCSIVERDNIIGMQFHPEKSHKYGMQIFKNFAEM